MTTWVVDMLAWHNLAWHDPPARSTINHKDLGMSPASYALTFGIISGISLPIGAWLGITFSPVSDKVCSMMMAFGAGALLFAVTVELYAHALMEVMSGRSGLIEMSATVVGAFTGCAFYLTIEKVLQDRFVEDEASGSDEEKSFSSETAPIIHALHSQRAEAEKAEAERQSSGSSMQRQSSALRRQGTLLERMSTGEVKKRSGKETAIVAMHDVHQIHHARSVALALFLGLLIDGVPEGILMGFLAAENHLTPVLIISLIIANFPTAFSSSSLLIKAQMSSAKIIGLWSSLCLLVGFLGGLSCWLLLVSFPEFGQAGFESKALPIPVLIGIAGTEGLTGGAMLACISGVMLPEAFDRGGKSEPFYSHSGFLCVAGFITSLTLKTLFG